MSFLFYTLINTVVIRDQERKDMRFNQLIFLNLNVYPLKKIQKYSASQTWYRFEILITIIT